MEIFTMAEHTQLSSVLLRRVIRYCTVYNHQFSFRFLNIRDIGIFARAQWRKQQQQQQFVGIAMLSVGVCQF